jgi:hypothetical protein
MWPGEATRKSGLIATLNDRGSDTILESHTIVSKSLDRRPGRLRNVRTFGLGIEVIPAPGIPASLAQ